MKNFFKKNSPYLFLAASLVIVALLVILPEGRSFAQSASAGCSGLKSQVKGTNGQFSDVFSWVPDQFCSVQSFLLWVVQTILAISGIVATLFIILGGYRYLTSAGSEEGAEKGRNTLTHAVIGLIVIALSFAIVRVVINTVTSGGSSGSNSGNPTDTGSGSNNPGGSNNPSASSLASFVSFSPSMVSGQDFTVTANIPSSQEATLSSVCGGTGIYSMMLLVNGMAASNPVTFTKDQATGNWVSHITVAPNLPANTSVKATALICQAEVTSETFTVFGQ